MKKMKIEEQAKLLLNAFKEAYEPKNKFIEEIVARGQYELNKGQIPQVALKKVTVSIYQIILVEKITIGDRAGELLNQMQKLSRSNGFLGLGALFNPYP